MRIAVGLMVSLFLPVIPANAGIQRLGAEVAGFLLAQE
jgi:hypothetical protein